MHTISDSEPDDNESLTSEVTASVGSPVSSPKINRRKKRTKEEIAADKAAKFAARLEMEKQREKNKSLKPGECLKFVEVSIDVALVENQTFGPILLSSLRSLCGLSLRVVPEKVMVLPPECGIMRWRRRQTTSDENWQFEPDIFLVLSTSAFLDMTTNPVKKFEDLLSELRNLTRKEPVIAVHGKLNRKTKSVRNSKTQTLSLEHWHNMIVKLHLEKGITIHLIENSDEMGNLVRCLTKSVAERPFKLKSRSAEAIFCTSGAYMPSIRVSEKDPDSVSKLWRQQLTEFRLVTGDIADAIVSNYRTPKVLSEALKQCINEDKAKELLANVEVRRGAGMLQTKRRIGKELSRRIYEFLTASNHCHVIR